MCKKLPAIILALLLLLPLASCAGSKDLLYTVTKEEKTYSVFGSGNRPRRITVSKGETTLFEQKIEIEKEVGALDGTYGFAVTDLNFDGFDDFLIVDSVLGECRRCLCFLWNPTSGTYQKSETLSGLNNLYADADKQALFAFRRTQSREKAYADVPETTITYDTTTMYIWDGNSLLATASASMIFYSETRRYCYSLSYRNEDTGKMEIQWEQWWTEAEYADMISRVDMRFLYYFR